MPSTAELNGDGREADNRDVGATSPGLAGTLVDLRPRALLQFLALTRKTGRLHVHQHLHHAAVWLRDGEVVSLDHDPLDSVVEVLRMANGDFGFDAGPPPDADGLVGHPVAALLAQATARLAEWEATAQAVPSMSVVVELCRGDDEVRLSADAWNASLAVAAGETTPQRVAAHLRWDALRTCRAVKELVDSGRARLVPPERKAPSVLSAAPAVPLWPGADADGAGPWRTPWYDPGD